MDPLGGEMGRVKYRIESVFRDRSDEGERS